MKFIFGLIVAFLLVGCSTTYTFKDFKSDKAFYNQLNNLISDNSVKIVLNNDSTFTINEKGTSINDNYLSFQSYRTVKDTIIAISEIKKINYYGTDIKKPAAHFELKNGIKFDGENIRILKDSLELNAKLPYLQKIHSFEIKEISFKKSTKAIVNGSLCGLVAGILLTTSKIIPANLSEGNPPYPNEYNYLGVAVYSVPLGIIIGGITGGIIGYNYTYKFNP